MPLPCKVCLHPNRLEIDRKLVRGESVSGIAVQYNFARHQIDYHKWNHLSRQLAKAAEMKQQKETLNLAEDLVDLKNRAQSILQRAESEGKDGLALKGISEARAVIETFARIGAMLQQGKVTNEAENRARRMQNLQNLTRQELEILERLLRKAERGIPENIESPEPEPVEEIPYEENDHELDEVHPFEIADDAEPVELNFDAREEPHHLPARRRKAPDIDIEMSAPGKVCFKPLVSFGDLQNG